MPHKDTSVAIKQAINRALNATQGQWVLKLGLTDPGLVNRELSCFFIAGFSLRSFKFLQNLSSCLKCDLIFI